MTDPEVPPRFWRALEALHSVVYFAPDTRETYESVGLRGFWMGYFASRAAALGPASPQLVTALFFGFAPKMVERALPDAWARASPDTILKAREDLAARTLTALTEDASLRRLADRLEAVLPTLDLAGRPLAAAHLSLAGSDTDVARVWRAATVLREYRGDCHVAALVAAGLDGAEANLSHLATGALPSDQRANRGWTEDEWFAARRRLRDRGWLDPFGTLTPEGRTARETIETTTDLAANGFARYCSRADFEDLTNDVVRLAAGPVERGIPYPNAMGVLRP